MGLRIDKVKAEFDQLGLHLNSTWSRFRSKSLTDVPHNFTNFWVVLHRIMPYTLGHIDAVGIGILLPISLIVRVIYD